MHYFEGMNERETILQPRVDDDFDMLGMQFSVRQYAERDRIFVDGVKYGLSVWPDRWNARAARNSTAASSQKQPGTRS
jgi:hypothetical protein